MTDYIQSFLTNLFEQLKTRYNIPDDDLVSIVLKAKEETKPVKRGSTRVKKAALANKSKKPVKKEKKTKSKKPVKKEKKTKSKKPVKKTKSKKPVKKTKSKINYKDPEAAKKIVAQRNAEKISSGDNKKLAQKLQKLTAVELGNMCRGLGVKISGNKTEKITRLIETKKSFKELKGAIVESKTAKSSKTTKTKTDIKSILPKNRIEGSEVYKKIANDRPTIIIRKNKYGNRLLPNTKLVYSIADGKVIAREGKKGKLLDLKDKDIEHCKSKNIDYVLPENLDSESK